MTELWITIITAAITTIIVSWIGYFFGHLKDKKIAITKYSEESLRKIYIPIYKILIQNVDPLDGYEGITGSQHNSIKKIADNHIELCDPKLESLIWRIEEDIRHEASAFSYNQYDLFDQNRNLFNYVLHAFNKTRRSIGLPFDIFYVYPILYKLRYSNSYLDIVYKIRRFKRKLKSTRKKKIK
ncbi:hypothetical protein [Paenisporosarcina sp. TG-14]|uniref:hypothetical protein n=1 Tax=Paenisporosarcina sp. TG-14 TaxID=1231057 RepID=UPI0002D8072C|nr:hypothetical protein [Paenisporosarcina sp. TG-14]